MAKTHRVNKMDEEMLEEVPMESTEEEEETMEEESDEENSRLFGNYDMTQAADTVGKKKKPGIIYLSSIPPGFNVSKTIMFFSEYGKIGRVFLQPGKSQSIGKPHFTMICVDLDDAWSHIRLTQYIIILDVSNAMHNCVVVSHGWIMH